MGSDFLLSKEHSEIHFNTKVKVYPDGQNNIIYCNYPIFKEKGWEERPNGNKTIDDIIPKIEEKKEDRERLDVLKRAKDKVFDISYCNEFTHFLTITFNPEEVDSKNPLEVMKKLKTWLNHQVCRKGLKYLLIPELHKKGGIHCHALINDIFSFSDSGKLTKSGKTIYNVNDWNYGFSTAIKLDDNKARVSHYITKYITKDLKKIFGKYYWSSKNIVRSPQIYFLNSEFTDIPQAEITIDGTTVCYKYESNIGWVSNGLINYESSDND